ncbi:non-ribosomal peptide synthase/polyketide synthase [Flavobacterium sp. FlaQc-52]
MNIKSKLHIAQQEVYYGQLMNPESPLYNIGGYTIFKGSFDVSQFKQVIEGLSDVFDVFNIKFDFTENEPAFYISDFPEKVFIDELDFSSELEPRKKASEWMQNQFNIAFDLKEEKLYKYTLIKIGKDEYWWFVCFHHLITDGFGFAIKVDYVINQYENFIKGEEGSEVQYPSYLDATQKSFEYINSEQCSKDKIYWEEKYNAVPKKTVNEKYINEVGGGRFSLTVSDSDKALFNRLSESTKANIPQLTIAALLLYFGKTTDEESFSFGIPIHNRVGRQERKTLGMFAGMLPYKGNYAKDQVLSDLLSEISQTQRNDYRHRLYPISFLNRSLKLLSENRLQVFDVAVNYEPLPFPKSLSPDLSIEIKHLSSSLVEYPLSIRWCDYGQDLPMELNVDYQKEYFNSNEIEVLVTRLLHIIRQFEFGLDQSVADLSILTTQEEYQLLDVFNNTTVEYPKDKTIVDLFEEQVKKTPDATAVVYEGKELSYKEVNEKSNQLGHYLKEQGVEADTLVGICLERSLEMLVGILGILKSGAAYVPIDPDYPEDRIAHMVSDAGMELVLSSAASHKALRNPTGINVLLLDRDWDLISGYAKENLSVEVASSHLAYVIYTSGSTGRPKGVMIEHTNVVNLVASQIALFSIDSSDVVLQFSNFVFDASVEQIFMALCSGSKLVLINKETILDTENLLDFIDSQDVTHFHTTPSMLSTLAVRTDLKSLRRVVVGGETCSKDLMEDWNKGYAFYNEYGPTETTVTSTISFYNKGSFASKEISIGRPIGNTGIYILNTSLDLVPVGVIGELCVGGSGVARGYLNQDELTQEKFIRNPFVEGDRIYRTGDLVRWLADGNIEYIGRKDDQVKIRGYRIELGEIENILSSLEAVIQCCVLAKEDVGGNKRLVAYVVAEGKLNKTALQDQLKVSLPEYMVPMIWVELDKMPLTSNGKLDKKALPDPDNSDLSSQAYVAPRTEIEEQLAAIWQNLLGIEKVGVYDNFFELGGHSLLAVQLISRLQKLDFHIEVKDIFAGPTIVSMSEKLSSLSLAYRVPTNGITVGSDVITPSMVPLVDLSQSDLDKIIDTVRGGVSNIEDIYPLSPLQEGIHFHHLMSDSKEGDPYVLPNLLSFSDQSKRNSFIEALQFVVNRHDVLRTCILSSGLPVAVQVVLREAPLWIEHLELDHSKAVLPQLELLIAPGGYWMDVTKAPLLQLKSADDTQNGCYYLIVYQHHLISDFYGMEKIISEITTYLSGNGDSLGVPVLYRDFIGHTLHAKSVNNGASYFKSLLGAIEEPTYPFDLVNVLGDGKGIEESHVVLSKDLSTELRKLSVLHAISPAVLFHAAYGLVVAKCSNKDYAIFGSLFSGRLQGAVGAADSLGLFINTLPVIVTLKGGVSAYVNEVKVLLQDLLSYEQTPLSHIQDWSGIGNDKAFFSALLNYRHSTSSLSQDNQTNKFDSGITVLGGHERTNYPFTLSINDYGDDFSLNAQVDGSIGAKRILVYMENALTELLEGLKREELNINTLNILSKGEEHQLLDIFNNVAVAYPKDKTIVTLFEEQVKNTPDAIAVVYEGAKLSYKELNEKSNQLGSYLREQGVQPDTLVGICVERGLEMLVGILGILKSGGAYVPIDPDYPEDRIAYMIGDAGINLVLSSAASHKVLEEYADINVVLLDTDWNKISNYLTENLSVVVAPDHLAYVIYTSGSTGNPKGVLITHSNVVRLFKNESCLFDFGTHDVWTLFHSFCFDFSVWEMYGALLHGGRLVVVPKAVTKDAISFKELLISQGVTVLNQTPGSFYALQEAFLSENFDHAIRYVIFGGEALNPVYLQNWKALYPSCKMINMYGITETTVHVTYKELTSSDLLSSVSAIGSAIPTLGCYILDANLNLVPVGVIGELCVGGAGVARGYLNREELTQEKFIANPFVAGDRLYRSGDLGRWLADGSIEYIGRKDNQVKIRGYRIELGEIENALSLLETVTQCCVLAKEDTAGNKRLVGYVVLEGSLNKEILQEQLKLSLPEYMVPMIWIELDKMPLTSNGKLDKKALPNPDSSDLSTQKYVAPRTDTERQLAAIWQNLLAIEKVGIYDNFFELGGHSLLATRLVSMIRKELSTEVSIREVFESTTIAALGAYVSAQSKEAELTLATVVVEDRPKRIPLSFSQERLWFLDQLQGSTEYHISIALRLEGELDVLILEQTLQTIVSRHEVLRTMLLSEDGQGYQEIISPEDWRLDQFEITNKSVLDSNLQDYLKIPFDLSKDYKLRSGLFDLGNQNYVLTCVFHHIASDGWSSGILVNEFTEIYNALQSGRTAVLPELTLQYSDYAIWQRKYLEGAILKSQLTYWQEKLQGVATLSLPTDYARPSVQSTAGSNVSLVLDKELSASLRALCQKEGVTLFMLLLSAFKVLLSRYSGQDDICVGTPIANRTQSELEGMIGFFVNTLALRSDLGGNPSFSELLFRIKKTTLDGYDHQLVPFERVVDQVVTARDMSMTPLFQVMFVLQNTPEDSRELALENITLKSYEFDAVTSQFDLTLNVVEDNNSIALDINYCTALFDKVTIDYMLLHYQELLAGIVNNINQSIDSLSMLTAKEEYQLLNVFNNTAVEYPKDKTIVALFEEQVKNTPDAIAVVYEGAKLSYKELNERSNQLGSYLREQGVQPDTLVGICIERGLEMLVGILGILKSGGAYVPIDPDYPEDRIAYMIDDAGINLVLSSAASHKVLEEYATIDVVLLDTDWNKISNYSTENLNVVVAPDHLAYVIYTSGSTGNPKGVLITHSNVVRLFKNESCLFDFGTHDVWTLFHSFCFDFSVWEMYGALLHGGRLVVVPKAVTKDAISFKELLISEGVTVLNQTPGSFYALQEAFLSESFDHAIRYVIFGGEALNPVYLQNWKALYPSCKMINMYGITETTVHVTYKELTSSDMLSSVSAIGSAIPTLGCYILDANLNLVPVGVIGELCVGGAGVARGYLNREELTQEKFITNPFVAGDRLYRSGDLGRWLADGSIEYIGRKDNQVKIRGYRIELGEIENALSLLESVTQCCVLAKEDAGGNKRLVAYVVSEDKLDKTALQDQLKLSLPEYMVPMIWVGLDHMPLTSNGKLDRKALPNPDNSALSTQEYVAPRTEIERQLAAIWQNLLGIEKVSVYDNFFELGGHSLLATRLVSMIRKELSVELSIREVFQYTTISALGTHVSAQSKGVLLPVIVVEDRPERIPLSFSQERLWFLDQLQGSTEYHIPIALRLEGELNVSILEQTLQVIVSRHEVLHTILLSEDGLGYQEVISPEDWRLDQFETTNKGVLDNNLQEYLKIPFDLSKDYKLRSGLFDLGNQNYVLTCVFHHIASDGWSGGILVNEFMEIYNALQSGRAAVLPELVLQYSDYAIWQRKYLNEAALESELSYWEANLQGVATLSLPTDYARPSVQSTAGSNVSLVLDKELGDSLKSLCQKEGVTLFMLLLSAFKVLLSRYSGQDDICVGTPIANRTQSELEGVIGFFVNTLALRSDLGDNPSFRELLSRVKETTLGSYDHQLVPFEKVVGRVVTTRDRNTTPLFQVMFVLQNTPEGSGELALENVALSNYEFNTVTSQFDLTLNVSEVANCIALDLVYCTDLFDKATIDRMLMHYQELLVAVISDSTQPINSLSILTLQEEQQLLDIFNNTTAEYSKDKTLVDLFEEQVKKTPDAIAVVFEGEELSYKELNEKSNQLGFYLREQGVEPDALVGICLERSLEMLVGILGILKSGAAYVPIDPDYPSDRIVYMLNDTGIKLMVSSEKCHKVLKDPVGINVLLLDRDWDLISGYAKENLSVEVAPSHLAYVIYTSGSTGRPKGVMIEHTNVVNLVASQIALFSIDSSDVVLQFSNFVFDASVEQIFMALCSGSKLVLINKETILDTENLLDFIDSQDVTHFHTTPSMLSTLAVRTDLKSLRRVVVGGETCSKDLMEDWNKGYAFYNEYGPTETTVTSTISFYNKGSFASKEISIGRPIGNTGIYILNTSLDLVPVGVIGELCIGGSGVARGYLNQNELTQEKFITNPFVKGDRIYRTGDLVRWLADGNIEYIGRKDDQVKIRGYRIELGEIENVLSSLESVIQCCVLAKEDASGNKRLVAYVVSESKLDKTALQDQLKLSLPEYMVPMIWIELDQMPLTSNGKLDRKALPNPDSSDLSTQEYVAPRTETEQQLAVIWQNLLGIEKVGVYDNFFELGGHSLLAVQLISRLQKLDFHIRVKDIFAGPTIALMSEKLSSLSLVYRVPSNGITVDSDVITPAMVPLADLSQSDLDSILATVTGGISNIEDIYPLSPLQEGIHFHHLMSDPKEGDPYVLPSLLSFTDQSKRDSFIEALQFVVNRHDVLRTSILSSGLPKAVQVVLREAPLWVEHLELDHSKAVLPQLELLIAPGGYWMDVTKAPLLQLKSADDTQNSCYYLIVYQHHLIIDHVGMEKIISEITMYLSGNKASLGAPVLYRDFIGHTLHAQSVNDGASYFKSLFGAIEEPTYPFDLSNVLGGGRNIEDSEVKLSESFSIELRATCVRFSMTPAVLFHAAYGLVVARCSNKDYAVFGSLFSGRLQGALGAADSLGLFINTLPVLLELKGSTSEYVNQVKGLLQDLLSYEQTPLSHIQDWSGIGNDKAFFSALLNYRHSAHVLTEQDETGEFDSGITVVGGQERTNYPFTLSVDDHGDDFSLTAQIDQSIGAKRILIYMENALAELLEGLKREELHINALSVLSKEESDQLLDVFNNTAVEYPKDKTILALFEEQVKNTPDTIAVVYEGEELTYKELNEKSNQLGHYLREQGAQSDTFIGICVERSLEMMVGILGILKSGSVYVPIDPDYPSDRIAYMVDDAGMKLVLSSATSHKVLEEYTAINVVLLDTDWDAISGYSTENPGIGVTPDDLAYVIYTSGSTGRPKGVMVTHGNIVSLSKSCDYLALNSETVWLSTGSISFDATTIEFWGTLLNGGQLIVASINTLLNSVSLKELLIERKVNTLWMTASWFHQVVESDLSLFEPLDYLIVGGDVVLFNYTNKLKELYPKLKVVNGYGPTENTTFSTTYTIDNITNKNLPIGKPINNSVAYILDANLNLVPVGVIGELCVGGSGVARGYLNQDELTQEKFIANPFVAGDRIYRTGDLVRWLADGNIEYIGRKDDQVKIRGYRIELGEIENVLSSLEAVIQCCVLAKEDASGNKRLVAYVVSESKLDKTALQEQLKLSLPEYMVPMIWIELDKMPLTSNGKLDKKALPNPDSSDLSTQEYVAPRTETEQQLAAIWQNLLGIEKVGVYDNFFELGGHSLLAVQLISRLQKLDFHIRVKDIFAGPTIALMSEKLSSLSLVYRVPANGITVDSDVITPAMVPLADLSQSDLDSILATVTGGISNIEDIYPLSPLQEGIHFHHLMSDPKEGDPYVLPSLLSFTDQSKRDSFIEALQFVVNRHDVLRTSILSSGLPKAVQVVLREAPLWVEHLELDHSKAVLPQLELLIAPGGYWMDVTKAPLLQLKSADDTQNSCYYLIVYQHHLIIDHVGMEKIIAEITMYLSGNKANLGVPVLYRDFIGHTLHAQSVNDGASYFKSLFGAIEEPTYPFDLSNVLGGGRNIEDSEVKLSESFSIELRATCVRFGMTPAVLFHAAYGLVVARCSNKDYAVFGSLFSGRLQGALGAADSLGLFINTLPVLLELKGSTSEYVNQVKGLLQDLLSYEQTPLSHIQDWSGIGNDKAFFSALLNYRHSAHVLTEQDETGEFDSGITVVGGQERTNYPFTLSVDDHGDDFSLTAQIDQSIGAKRILIYMENALAELLEGLKSEELNINALSILSKEESDQLLDVFNNTAVEYPKDKTILALFEEQVKNTPDAIAVVYEGEELSYKELNEKSNQLGYYLREQGAHSDTFIGICVERSLEMMVGILGILKSGSVYVPIDPDYPSDRIAYMIDDAGMKLVLSSAASHKVLEEYTAINVVLLDTDWDAISGYSTENPGIEVTPDALAYVIYTSGSTGRPKGVMVTHGNIVSLSKSCDYISLNSETVWLSTGSISFDATTIEFWGTLLNGGQLIVASINTLLNSVSLKELLIERKVTTLWMTASWFHQVVESDLSLFEPLDYLIVGGDVVLFNYTNKLKELYPNLKVVNGYGPTENTTFSTTYTIDNITNKNLPIGKPINNSVAYILDANLNLVPIGVIGELCVGGSGVARGYLNQDELTQEKFITNPFVAGDRIYRTGDLVRWLADGNIEYIGRKDDQVKIRGYRIELGEIENVLSSLEVVIQCCVLAKEDASGNKRLVAYVVSENKLDKTALQDQLKLSLPEYMVPMIWVELDHMPLTSNGKLDRKALPNPDNSDLSTQEYVAPRTETEQQLAVIWQNLLGIEKVGIYDNFFELGGHSLLATRLASMIRKELSIEIAIREVFEYTTIATLGAHISVQSEGVALPAIVMEERPKRIPLSFSQERLWFLDQLQGSTEYHIPVVLRLEGELEVSILEQTLQTIVLRHEVLRTVLLSEEGVGYQEVISPRNWMLDQVKIRDRSLLESTVKTYLMSSFDLSKDYKLRGCLYDLGNREYVLACVFHHIASDGWSEGILVREFMELYSALKSGRATVLPELTLQYSDYAIWQRKYLEGAVLESQLSYWQEKLQGVATLSLPTDYARPSVQSTAGSNVSFTLNKEISESLRALCQKEGVTLFMLLLSAFKVLLSRYSGQDDICVGTPIANRTQSELEGMIGFFVNTLALRSDLGDNPSFSELLVRVKETTLDGYDHQLASFEKVVDRVASIRDMSITPLFQVMFVLQNTPEDSGELTLENITLTSYEFDVVTAQFDLTLNVAEESNGIALNMNYCTALFDKTTIDRMVIHYQELLVAIISDSTQLISSLSMLTLEEEHQLLDIFNTTAVEYPKDKTIVDLFEEQVKNTPDAIAVVYEGAKLSYKELNERSNQLGSYLREQGVQPDTLVGICVERGLEMLIGILGILKSGGAYVPIDPDYPEDRIAYMVGDAGINLVLSSAASHKVLEEYTDINVVLLDTDWDKISNYSTENLSVVVAPDHLAYVIYTSGSTGNPKGVLITHSNVVRLFKNESCLFDFGTHDVWTLFHSFCFDFSVWEMYGALLHGGRLVVVPKAVTKDAISFKELLISEGVTVLNQTPGSFYALQEAFLSENFDHAIRYVIFGGEALNPVYLQNWKALYPSCKMINMYGITETTVHVTYKELKSSDLLSSVSAIGSAIPTLGCYILDANLNLVPVGVIGELCVGGAGVARGYLNREELTQEKFIANPFVAGDRLYRSGDLGRWLADGSIEYIGRKDNQVKIRGYRIELGEIENALSLLESVTQCCVLAKEDVSGNKRLVGYVVLEGSLNKEVLQEQLKLSLPEYMVPMIWVELGKMPLTSNGKLDKKALPDPDNSQLSSKEYVEPRTDTERQLVEIWQNLLGIEKVGIYDNFFELGGHSLLVTRLISIIRDELAIEVSIRNVFKFKTAEELASYIDYKIRIAENDTINYSVNINI